MPSMVHQNHFSMKIWHEGGNHVIKMEDERLLQMKVIINKYGYAAATECVAREEVGPTKISSKIQPHKPKSTS